MILTSKSLFPWLLLGSFIIFIFSQNSSSPPFRPKEIKQRFNGGWKPGCDISNGSWVRDNGSSHGYTNQTCKTLPESKNCGKYGKKGDYKRWRWQPARCDLPRFSAVEFLEISRGKRMAFVGDSVARNQADSLVCFLSETEIPKSLHKDQEDKFPIWHFESHNFTLMVMWTKFLVQGNERLINGSGSGDYDLQLDTIDREWAEKIQFIDYVVISSGHWFSRKIYLYEGGELTACIYCSEKNVTNHEPTFGLQKAFKTTLQFLDEAKDSDQNMFVLLRTFSPAHFENGTWNDGGYCNRTRPFDESELSLTGTYWEIRNAQVEEVNKIKIASRNVRRRFKVLDITKAMMMRPDAHPDKNWNNEWMRGYRDCVHWCLPGAVDMWNDMMLILLKEYLMEIGSIEAESSYN